VRSERGGGEDGGKREAGFFVWWGEAQTQRRQVAKREREREREREKMFAARGTQRINLQGS
jgi:hypothetical protein